MRKGFKQDCDVTRTVLHLERSFWLKCGECYRGVKSGLGGFIKMQLR